MFLAVLGAYANHFHNSFQFDDAHTVVENAFIRNLHNIPRFFIDGTTFSSLPANQSYRPLISTTLAIDYYLGRGLNPPWFHIDTFLWYILLLAAMFFLYLYLMEATAPSPRNGYLAMFAVALFGLHPVSSETVNYVVQRGEVHSTLGVVLGLVMYIYWRRGRAWGAYLVPVIVGSLSKPPALMFLPILFVYVYLFESDAAVPAPVGSPGAVRSSKSAARSAAVKAQPASRWTEIIVRGLQAARASIPSAALFVAMGLWQLALTPKTYTTGQSSPYLYRLTQPSVVLHYMKEFFLPTDLSADTDRKLVSGIFSATVLLSVAMLVAPAVWAWPRLRRPEMRPLTFGLWWFLFALAPTSLLALSEVDNDHRMFFPFVGFTLAVVWAVSLIPWLQRHPRVMAAGAILLLGACAWGTHQRNIVWHSEESLWKDVTVKSPGNGRGFMNYGIVLLNRGDSAAALDMLRRADALSPNRFRVKLNLGRAQGAVGDDAAAEASFHEAIALAPNDAECYSGYARYLKQHNYPEQAIALLLQAIAINGSAAEPRYLLMEIYSEQGDGANLRALARETLQVFPGDATAAGFLAVVAQGGGALAVNAPSDPTTPEDFLMLAIHYELAGQHEKSIAAATHALKLRPGYAEAYNTIAAAQKSMGHWDEAVQAAREAVRLKPDFQVAKSNLQFLLDQQRLHAGEAVK
jgi:tetratricopeptide (TPR) repeat protein